MKLVRNQKSSKRCSFAAFVFVMLIAFSLCACSGAAEKEKNQRSEQTQKLQEVEFQGLIFSLPETFTKNAENSSDTTLNYYDSEHPENVLLSISYIDTGSKYTKENFGEYMDEIQLGVEAIFENVQRVKDEDILIADLAGKYYNVSCNMVDSSLTMYDAYVYKEDVHGLVSFTMVLMNDDGLNQEGCKVEFENMLSSVEQK